MLRHWQELGYSNNVSPAPDFEMYSELAKADRLRIYAVRLEELLLGYAVFFIVPDPLMKDRIVAINNLLWLDHAYRRGFTGTHLMKYANQQLQEAGCDAVSYLVNPRFPALSILLERLYFKRTTEVWEKDLKG